MAQTDVYNFQAPQFIESLSEVKLDDGADTFFDATDSVAENVGKTIRVEVDETSEENGVEKAEKNCLEDEINENGVEETKVEASVETDADQVPTAQAEMEEKNRMSVSENDENKDPEVRSNGPLTRLQRMSMKTNGSLGLKNQPKFLSVAEQIHKFHHSTPPRFKRKSVMFKSNSCKFLPTVAHSPQLRTKIRAARPSTAPTTVVPDEKIVIKKKEVIKGVSIKPVPKPPTVPVPFNLTVSGNKKQQEDKNENTKVTNTNEKKQSIATPRTLLRKPLPPKKKHLEIHDNKITVKESWRVTGIKAIQKPNSTTKAVPFSFEKRNQERLMEKQRKLEEEQNKAASATSIPKKLPRPSTASYSGATKPLTKVKNEKIATGRVSRSNVK